MNWNKTLVDYFSQLECPEIPNQYGCMNPYKNEETMRVVTTFLNRFYDDDKKRTLLFGINPGRFGSGLTGISFTDPLRLKSVLGIDHSFDMRPELSSEFIYEVIDAFGGPEVFYSSFFISAAYPLGFLHEGKNINYYEFKDWKKHMLKPLQKELLENVSWPVNRDRAICIGRGENFKILNSINDELHLFKEIVPLPHPRWVLQYRRKRKLEFVDEYHKTLQSSLPRTN